MISGGPFLSRSLCFTAEKSCRILSPLWLSYFFSRSRSWLARASQKGTWQANLSHKKYVMRPHLVGTFYPKKFTFSPLYSKKWPRKEKPPQICGGFSCFPVFSSFLFLPFFALVFLLSLLLFDILKPKKVPTRWGLSHKKNVMRAQPLHEKIPSKLPWRPFLSPVPSISTLAVLIRPGKFRDAPDTFNFLRHVMRAIWSVRPKCSHRCVSLKETL